jgi:hypothetical protein
MDEGANLGKTVSGQRCHMARPLCGTPSCAESIALASLKPINWVTNPGGNV